MCHGTGSREGLKTLSQTGIRMIGGVRPRSASRRRDEMNSPEQGVFVSTVQTTHQSFSPAAKSIGHAVWRSQNRYDIHTGGKVVNSARTPISLAGSQLAEIRRVCALFNSEEEEYRVLLPSIKNGLKSGDKAVHVLNPQQRQGHLQRLAAASTV